MKYLFYEFVGRHCIHNRYLYVTDGGHYENLGLVELLRRRCSVIFCFDAAGGQVSRYDTLGQAIALARAEEGVEIVIDPTAMRPPDREGVFPGDHVVGTIKYPKTTKHPEQEGVLVFTKASITRRAPWDVRAYAERDHRFPTHSTADQLYKGERFEAYQTLGATSACSALDTMAAILVIKALAPWNSLAVGLPARARPSGTVMFPDGNGSARTNGARAPAAR